MATFTSIAQVPLQFSHVFSAKEMVNPAYAVLEEDFAFKVLSRAQWEGIEGNPTTSGFTLFSPLKNSSISFGGLALNLLQGSMIQTNMSGFIDIKLKVSRHNMLSFGLQAGGEYNYFDFDKMITYYKIDRNLAISQGYDELKHFTFLNPTFGSGAMLYNDSYFASVSSFIMINGNKLLDINFYQGTYFMGGYIHEVGSDWRIRELLLYKLMYHQPDVVEVGAKALYYDIIAMGASYRHKEYINLSCDMRLNDKVRLGLGYDIQTTAIRHLTYGSFEVRLEFRSIDLKKRQRTNTIHYLAY